MRRVALAAVVAIVGAACAGAQEARRFADWTLLQAPGQGCVLQYRAVAPEAGLALADLYLSQVDEGGRFSRSGYRSVPRSPTASFFAIPGPTGPYP